MIKTFEATNFKSIRQLSMQLARFNVLVGPNGSGKTNVIRSMELLGLLLNRGTTDPASDLGWDQIIRRDRRLPARSGITLAAEVEVPAQVVRRSRPRKAADDGEKSPIGPMMCRVSVKLDGSIGSDLVRVVREELTLTSGAKSVQIISEKDAPLQVRTGGDRELWDLVIPYRSRIRDDADLDPEVFREAVFDEFERPFDAEDERRLLRVLNYQRHYSPWLGYVVEACQVSRLRADASALRGEAMFPESSKGLLGPSGQGLAFAIDRLRGRGGTARRGFQRVLGSLQQVYPRIENIRAQRVPGGRLTLLFKEAGISEELGLESISDGVLHALALLVVLESDDENGLLAIEEPENAIHPWSVRAIVARAQIAPRRQVLLTTHSETVVSAVADAGSLLITERQGERGTTVVPAKDRVDALDAILRETGQDLGDIWMGGSLGGVPQLELQLPGDLDGA